MDSFLNFNFQVTVEDDRTIVRFFAPKSVVGCYGAALIKSYVERLYDVVSFRVSFDPRNFGSKITFCVKGSSFDVRRFSHFLFSL